MSGVEVIGLVLGGLPLIISAAEHYKKGFEPLARWKRFKFVFREFINSVDIQRQMFQLVMKKLLIRVQLEPEEKQRLLTIPDYEGWHRSDVVEALRLRLGDSYDACMGTSYSRSKKLYSCFRMLRQFYASSRLISSLFTVRFLLY